MLFVVMFGSRCVVMLGLSGGECQAVDFLFDAGGAGD
jgi:hypothetical protein